MARRNGQETYKRAFGEALEAQLHARQMTQTELAARTGRSVSYVNRTMTGTRFISPEWAETVSKALSLTDAEGRQLHTAAAIDAGYKLDLTKR